MELKPRNSSLDAYLRCDSIIDFDNEAVKELSDYLFSDCSSQLAFIESAYEYVRDRIPHSADIEEDALPCSASEVLAAGHGICFAKSHLLAALLRAQSVPTGFCYQRIILDNDIPATLVLHGLNGIYSSELGRWIRLDARGNKDGIDAHFSPDCEQLAYPIRSEFGEADIPFIYADPADAVISRLREYGSRRELWNNLPTDLPNQV